VPYLVGGSMVLLLGVRIANCLARTEYTNATHVYPTHLRLDALLFGVAMAYAYHFHANWFRKVFHPIRYGLIVVGAVLVESSVWLEPYRFYVNTVGFMQFYLGAAAILAGVLMCEIPRNRLTAPLGLVGVYSYSIYLWHMSLMYWAMPALRKLGMPWGVRTGIYMVGALVIGVGMAKIVEQPILRFRDRRFPSRSGSVVSQPCVAEEPSVADVPLARAA